MALHNLRDAAQKVPAEPSYQITPSPYYDPPQIINTRVRLQFSKIWGWLIWLIDSLYPLERNLNKMQPTNPECSHVEHLCEASYLNSLDVSPVTVPVRCRLWNAQEGGVQSVECGV